MLYLNPNTELYNVPAKISDFHGMPYKQLGKTGLRASAVGLGTWKYGYPETGDGARVDGSLAHQIFDRAWELGVGSLIVGMYKEDLLRERFRIPEHYGIVGLLLLGYPKEDCQPHPQLHFQRKKLEETVFYGTF